VAHGLKVDEAQTRAHVAGLAAAQLVQDVGDGSPVQFTAAGEQAHRQIRAGVAQVTEQLRATCRLRTWRSRAAS
jgi:hypothetical protein